MATLKVGSVLQTSRRAKATLYVVRGRVDDGRLRYKNSKPCATCVQFIRSCGFIKKVVYSTVGGLVTVRVRDLHSDYVTLGNNDPY
jgi:hypothetical protein